MATGETNNSKSGAIEGGGRSFLREVFSFFKTLLLFLIIAFILRASFVEAYKIPSGSMIPTLRIGDHILVSKLSYGLRVPYGIGLPFRIKDTMLFQYDTPKRGDVVVFTRPDDPNTEEDESAINIIKRVIGLPGDVVEVRGTQVFINGQPLDEPYARWVENGIPEGNFGPEKVPEGKVLLLGDNRDRSKDSRFWSYPFLDISRIKGRALIVYWSWDSLKRIGTIIR
ncbi:MAG: signal peptidase I [Candidatus Dadabacteria bacterium]|nr:MAG: signal peptidase I [Candidatus Dadabacteria bacterium]